MMRVAEYRDPTPINFNVDYDQSKVDPRVATRTKAVREKMYGIDTREAMAQAEEITSVVSSESKILSEQTKARQDVLEQRYDTQLAGNTDVSEVIDARTDVFGVTHANLNERNQVPEKLFKSRFAQLSRVGDFFNRLRNTTETLYVACIGDSLTYGADNASADRRPPASGTTDDGTVYLSDRASTTYPEALQEYLNMIYPGRVIVRNMGYPGDDTTKALQHWNASNADLAIIMLGTNDRNDADFDRFMGDYRKLVMREQENGTSVLIITPPKRRVMSSRPLAPYRNAVVQMAKEMNIPYVDMTDELANIDQSYYCDVTHFTGKGYRVIGAKVLAILTGESIMNPRKVPGNFLGLRDQIDGLTFGASGSITWLSSTSAPTPASVDAGIGDGVILNPNQTDAQGLLYSFYATEDNTVIYPSAYFNATNNQYQLEMVLDFDTRGIAMSNSTEDGKFVGQYEPPQIVTFLNGDQNFSTDKTLYNPTYLDVNHVDYWSDKKMIIPKKGWHTVWVRNRGTDVCTFLGLQTTTLDRYIAIKMANTPARITKFIAANDGDVSFRIKVSDINEVLRTAIKQNVYVLTPALSVTVKTDTRAICNYYVQLQGFTSNGNRILSPSDIRTLAGATVYRQLTDVTFDGDELVFNISGAGVARSGVVTIEVA